MNPSYQAARKDRVHKRANAYMDKLGDALRLKVEKQKSVDFREKYSIPENQYKMTWADLKKLDKKQRVVFESLVF